MKIFVLLFISITISTTSCSSVAPKKDITKDFTKKSESKRLRFFKEINFGNTLKNFNLTGKGVRITVMGETTDASHPDLNNRVIKQYNAFVDKNNIIEGKGNQPYRFEKMGYGDGHGTHIAGTIAAECDGIGIQGIACGSTIDVYSIGAYDSEMNYDVNGWGNTHEFARLFSAFSIALNDVTRRNKSKITTGSFNIESPVIIYESDSKLSGKTLTEIIEMTEGLSVNELFNKGLVKVSNKLDEKYLAQLSKKYDDPLIYLGSIIQLSKEWEQIEDAVQKYQKNGGVYLVTESNYELERTSLLNALPSISDKVDKDLWLSVVMVMPKGIDKIKSADDLEKVLAKGEYYTPLNNCGKTATEYCILTPSYEVLSTMTEKVRGEEDILFKVEGRYHQVFSGHSMGAPMVAAALALMQEYNIKGKFNYSMKDLVRILKESANRKFPTYAPDKHGQGMLDIANAIKMMQASPK